MLQVSGAFELQHGFSPPAFAPGIKKPAEAGYKGGWGCSKNTGFSDPSKGRLGKCVSVERS